MVLGAATGYFLMLLVVSISASGSTSGDELISKTMVFLETNPFGGKNVFDWKLTVPVLVGLLAGYLYSADKR